MCFDLEKAYDCGPQHLLFEVWKEYGVSGSLLCAIRSLYGCSKNFVCIVGVKSKLYMLLDSIKGVLFPLLFVISMESISRCRHGLGCVHYGGLEITSMLIPDDVVLLVSSKVDL